MRGIQPCGAHVHHVPQRCRRPGLRARRRRLRRQGAKRLKTTDVAESTCQAEACHGSYETLAEQTSSSTLLTDSNGTVVNPHDLPENADHETVTCGSCHDMHASDDIAETAQKACISCHHMGIYECNTCHD